MDNRIYFRLGGKSYDLAATKSSSEIWYEWVESASLSMRRMKLRKGALLWLCKRLKEASDIKGKSFKSWRCRGITTYIYCTLKFNKYGRFVFVITVNKEARSVIMLPENTFNEGWTGLISKINAFINKGTQTQKQMPIVKTGEDITTETRGGRSYKEVIHASKWITSEDKNSKIDTAAESKDPLRRSLVGSFPDCDEIPSRREVRQWVQHVWKGIHNIQVVDLNEIQFVFEFQSRKDAEQILTGKWQKNKSLTKVGPVVTHNWGCARTSRV